jgi:SAM-dependent methyltransferase
VSTRIYNGQFGYQREHSRGSILNIGCNTDGAQLGSGPGSMGAVNVDLGDVDQVTGEVMPVHIKADARDLPPGLSKAFDTAVLGELLEHMEREDAVLTLREAMRTLKPGGRIVITMPHDHRRDAGTLELPPEDKRFYAPGVYAYHHRSISWAELYGWMAEAGLKVVERSRIVYPWGEVGSGVVAVKEQEC